MSRRQPRRTVSVGADALDRARAYARRLGVPLSALTEYLLERQIRSRRFARRAYRLWRIKRDRRVLAAQRASGQKSRR